MTTHKESVQKSQGTTGKEQRVLEHSELFLDLYTLSTVSNPPNPGRGPDGLFSLGKTHLVPKS